MQVAGAGFSFGGLSDAMSDVRGGTQIRETLVTRQGQACLISTPPADRLMGIFHK